MQQYSDIYLLQSFAVNKYLHTIASGWIFINTQMCSVFHEGFECIKTVNIMTATFWNVSSRSFVHKFLRNIDNNPMNKNIALSRKTVSFFTSVHTFLPTKDHLGKLNY